MSQTDPLAAFLASTPLLRGLPADALARIARRAPAPRNYRPAGRTGTPAAIYDEGDASKSLFIVLDAAAGAADTAAASSAQPVVQVSVEDENLTTRVRLWRAYPRDHFGELEYLAGSDARRFPARLTKALALSPCRILEIPFALLDQIVEEHAIVFRRLARDTIARFQQTLEDTLTAKVSDPDIALANWLVERARDFGIREGNTVRFRAGLKQEEIGRDLGVSRETISLRLNEWRRRGLIVAARGSQLVVRDMDRVERIAALALERSRDEHGTAVASIDAALACGDNFRARNLALDVLTYFPGSAALKHRAALAVARCGATQEALNLLDRFGFGEQQTHEQVDRMVRVGLADPALPPKAQYDSFDLEDLNERIAELDETHAVAPLTEDILALAPRLWKDIAFEQSERDPAAARKAFDGYRKAFEASSRPYTGVNAASLACVLGLQADAEKLAKQVVERLRRAPDAYWNLATKGEALLLLGEVKDAADCFRAAMGCADATEGALAATRLQLTRLAGVGLPAADEMLAILRAPPVACYVGPAGTSDPALNAPALNNELRALIRERGFAHLHGGLGGGAEILIAEAALAEKASLHVALPCPVDDYAALALGSSGGDEAQPWRERFESCLAQAASLTIVNTRAPSARDFPRALLNGHRYAAGQALLRADALMAPCQMISFGNADAAPGLVAAVREDWESAGRTAIAGPGIWPAGAQSARLTADPWRPVVLAWLLAESNDGQLSARGIPEKAIAAAEAVVRANAGQSTAVLRRLLGGNRPQIAIAAIPSSLDNALELAHTLLAAKWPARLAVQVALDFGPVLSSGGEPNEDRLKELNTGSGPLEVPDNIIVASAAFIMAARFGAILGTSPIALGRVSRGAAAAGLRLLPSAEIFALRAARG
ncbi:MAG TPA: TRAFs-binding domain-containing protein [Roseomonas sp.]|nr:TRAFs-binding domain-containing protein [Roseomonas sp.]